MVSCKCMCLPMQNASFLILFDLPAQNLNACVPLQVVSSVWLQFA